MGKRKKGNSRRQSETANDLVKIDWSRHWDTSKCQIIINPQFTLLPPTDSHKEIILVLDTSGSMQGSRLENAKRAIRTTISSLQEGDHLSIISFNIHAIWIAKREAINNDSKVELLKKVDAIQAEGMTCPEAAMLLITTEVVPSPLSTTILFLTDGAFNSGTLNMEQLVKNWQQQLGETLLPAMLCIGLEHNFQIQNLQNLNQAITKRNQIHMPIVKIQSADHLTNFLSELPQLLGSYSEVFSYDIVGVNTNGEPVLQTPSIEFGRALLGGKCNIPVVIEIPDNFPDDSSITLHIRCQNSCYNGSFIVSKQHIQQSEVNPAIWSEYLSVQLAKLMLEVNDENKQATIDKIRGFIRNCPMSHDELQEIHNFFVKTLFILRKGQLQSREMQTMITSGSSSRAPSLGLSRHAFLYSSMSIGMDSQSSHDSISTSSRRRQLHRSNAMLDISSHPGLCPSPSSSATFDSASTITQEESENQANLGSSHLLMV